MGRDESPPDTHYLCLYGNPTHCVPPYELRTAPYLAGHTFRLRCFHSRPFNKLVILLILKDFNRDLALSVQKAHRARSELRCTKTHTRTTQEANRSNFHEPSLPHEASQKWFVGRASSGANSPQHLPHPSRGRSHTWYTAAPAPIVASAVTDATGCQTMAEA